MCVYKSEKRALKLYTIFQMEIGFRSFFHQISNFEQNSSLFKKNSKKHLFSVLEPFYFFYKFNVKIMLIEHHFSYFRSLFVLKSVHLFKVKQERMCFLDWIHFKNSLGSVRKCIHQKNGTFRSFFIFSSFFFKL